MVKKQGESWDWLKALTIAFIIAAIIRYFIFTPIIVDGHSMMPTLHNSDRMIINKISYHIGKPHRFDIIVFHATKSKDYIKRIIGLPGETVSYKNDVLYINGNPIKEPFLDAYKKRINGELTYDFKYKVPQGDVFVLGDNRQNSKDSRVIGPIPETKIVGKAILLFWPLHNFKIISTYKR